MEINYDRAVEIVSWIDDIAADEEITNYSDILITGSVVLKHLGFIDRTPNDLDIMFVDCSNVVADMISKAIAKHTGEEVRFYPGTEYSVARMNFEGVDLDIFFLDQKEVTTRHLIQEYRGGYEVVDPWFILNFRVVMLEQLKNAGNDIWKEVANKNVEDIKTLQAKLEQIFMNTLNAVSDEP